MQCKLVRYFNPRLYICVDTNKDEAIYNSIYI